MNEENSPWSIQQRTQAGRTNAQPAAARGASSSISRGARFSGRLELQDGGEFDGAIEGELLAGGELTIGQDAVVQASVTAERLKVFGQVEGDIECRQRLEVFSGAKIVGNITCPKVVMHDGVQFDGRCDMESGEKPFQE